MSANRFTPPPLPAELWLEILSGLPPLNLWRNIRPLSPTFASYVRTIFTSSILRDRTAVCYVNENIQQTETYTSVRLLPFSHSSKDQAVVFFKIQRGPETPHMFEKNLLQGPERRMDFSFVLTKRKHNGGRHLNIVEWTEDASGRFLGIDEDMSGVASGTGEATPEGVNIDQAGIHIDEKRGLMIVEREKVIEMLLEAGKIDRNFMGFLRSHPELLV